MNIIKLSTNHGIIELKGNQNETIKQVLERYRVPLSSVWTYTVEIDKEGKQFAKFISMTENLANAIASHKEVFARQSRNTDIKENLLTAKTNVRSSTNASTEWIFPNDANGGYNTVVAQLSPQECYDFVQKSVDEVLNLCPENDPIKIVVGTSGGGDSNVLLKALCQSQLIENKNIIPVMMLGIEDWDKQLPQAKEICKSLSLELNVISHDEVVKALGVKSMPKMFSEFQSRFKNVDFEFLGTYMLRKVLSSFAQNEAIKYVGIGANREDLLAEGLARISQSKLPLPIPYRKIGDVTFVYPMWKVPKKIGDGAFTNYSLVNYENRNPSFTKGRAIYYHLANMLPEVVAGIDVSLLNGFSQISRFDNSPIIQDEQLEDYVCKDSFSQEQLQLWKDFTDAIK
jgi:tRNA(Ile)-lysidine synthase TilS/MesJ